MARWIDPDYLRARAWDAMLERQRLEAAGVVEVPRPPVEEPQRVVIRITQPPRGGWPSRNDPGAQAQFERHDAIERARARAVVRPRRSS